MRCEDCRVVVSAQLDGEARREEDALVDRHLAGCLDCRRYADQAARVTRLARTEPVEPVPDLVASVRHALPTPRRARVRTALRALLAIIGVGQLGLATAELLAVPGHDTGAGLSGASLAHFSHESSAWNLALAVGFLCVAARPARLRGMVPLVGAFVAVLAALSAVDVVLHRVAGARLFAHGLVVLGLGAMLVLARLNTGTPSDGAPDLLAERMNGPDEAGADEGPRGGRSPEKPVGDSADGSGLKPSARAA